MGELELTAAAVSRQLRGFENAPILCVVSILCACPAIFIVVPLAVGLGSGGRGADAELCSLVAGIMSLVGWIVGAANFHRFCLGKAGWIAALVKYHIYALVTAAVVIGLFAGWLRLAGVMYGPFSSGSMPASYYVSTISLTAGLIVAIRWLLPRLHRRFRGDTLFLRREITIAIARDQILNRLRRGRR